MTKEQIEKLMQGATKGPWYAREQTISLDAYGGHVIYQMKSGSQYGICMTTQFTGDENLKLICALPDIAKTCLDLYARVEEMERQAKAGLHSTHCFFNMPSPNPGSEEAIKAGCKCPVVDNGYGKGYMGQKDTFIFSSECQIHEWNPEIKG